MAVSAGRGVPSVLAIAHQYSSRSLFQLGSGRVQTNMVPSQGQFARAYWKAARIFAAFWSSETANQEYAGWMASEVQPNSSSQIGFEASPLETWTWRSCSMRRK